MHIYNVHEYEYLYTDRLMDNYHNELSAMPEPCEDNTYWSDADTPFYLPVAELKYNAFGTHMKLCLNYDDSQTKLQIAVDDKFAKENRIDNNDKKFMHALTGTVQRYFWTTGYKYADHIKINPSEMFQPAYQYCKQSEKGCDDQDPLVFYSDYHVGFWKGWPNNWFQGYNVTAYDTYIPGSMNPINNPNNQFNFLTSNGYKWASSEHFLVWSRDQLLLNGTNSDKLALVLNRQELHTIPDVKSNQFGKKLAITQTNTSPKYAVESATVKIHFLCHDVFLSMYQYCTCTRCNCVIRKQICTCTYTF